MCRLFEGCRINADKYVIYILSCFTVQSYCCVLIIKPPAQSNKQARVCRLVCDNNCFPPVDLPSADHPTIALLPSTTTIPIIATLSLSLYTLGSFYERILIQKEKRIQLLQYREELFYIDNNYIIIILVEKITYNQQFSSSWY